VSPNDSVGSVTQVHIGKSYNLLELLAWTRRRAYVLLAMATALIGAYELLGWRWLALPWPVAALLGAAASFIVGFKNAHIYSRTVEAQQIWATLTSLTRYWYLLCNNFLKDSPYSEVLIRRHFAWLTALRYEARSKRAWETAATGHNDEYRRRYFRVPEHEIRIETELGRLLTKEELERAVASSCRTLLLLDLQSHDLRLLYDQQQIALLHHTEMQRTLKDLLEQQSRVERIKDAPYPRQYAVINAIFVWAFSALLPLCLAREFERLDNSSVGGHGWWTVWMTVPFAVLIAWLYGALDQVGESTSNPFEGSANDVPISSICARLENELLGTQAACAVDKLQPSHSAIIL